MVSKFFVLPLIVGSFCIAGSVMAEDNPAAKSSSVSEKDKTFMKKAAKGGMMEVAMGKTAEQNAQSEDVKSFGKRMVTDHSKANDELKSIADEKTGKEFFLGFAGVILAMTRAPKPIIVRIG